ncbi:hypothetical protein [Tenacibaculum sp. IB213877]|uniref:hypothetical protein n=1 Tax=Tenacibaculum sp. IB213877 TaxID=3097351 RepID=UPI002A5A3EE0|nr:hypothetical protein [Tenacibaculum sp. IB213877]MDY0779667.1 hypothetical protein [Tenacibaculum sp. IB213877]
MKKTTLLLLVVSFMVACSSVKKTQQAINTGNYDEAINLSIEKLRKDKYKEKNQPYVVMLSDAFSKVTERDLDRISFLEKERNPENLESIYRLYQQLNNRQERIKPLLPLTDASTGKNVAFNLANYDDDLIDVKEDLSEYLYNNALDLLERKNTNKYDYREVFNNLQYLDKINPNYKDVRTLLDEVHFKGTDFVYVTVKNQTRQIIPRRLEQDLLAMDTYGLNDFWTVFHAQKDRNIKYDFNLELNLRRIDISPERINEKEIIKEKQIKDGFKYLLDNKGNVKKDSLGNDIKVDKFKTVRCRVYQFTQQKSSAITGVVKYIDNNSRQLLESFPIQSEFVFEHSYANYDGDRRALNSALSDLIELREVRFPSNEQMVFDTGTDLKEKLKYIITRNKFRN